MVCVCVLFVSVHMPVENRGQFILVFDTLLPAGNLPSSLGWLYSEPQQSTCLPPQYCDYKNMLPHLCKNQFLLLARQAFYQTELAPRCAFGDSITSQECHHLGTKSSTQEHQENTS